MRRSVHRLFLGVQVLFVLMAGVYFGLAVYYRGGFSLNTWINGVYCTGKTLEEVNTELLSSLDAPTIVVVDASGTAQTVALDDCGYRIDYAESLRRFLNRQNPFLWINNAFTNKSHTVVPRIRVDEDLLRAKWESLPFVKAELELPEGKVSILATQEGYQLQDATKNRLDVENGYQGFVQAVLLGYGEYDISGKNLYSDLPYGEEDMAVLKLWETLQAYLGCRIVLDMGAEQIVLDATSLQGFLAVDEEGLPLLDGDGRLVIDDQKVESYVAKLVEDYDTLGEEREFQSTRGDVVTVPAGTYGTRLDLEAELAYLKDALARCVAAGKTPVNETHTPSYLTQAYSRGRNDIGDTYIEVDMTEQKMYYYADGECLVDTDVVTGNTGRRMGTPEGVYFVYAKQRNRTLRGQGYASFVRYWMPVNKNIGIHDAAWRDEFGGQIYQRNGSHGCINTPGEEMATLYENAEIGTPVVIFY